MPDATSDGTKRERTVGDIMSRPVVTARPAETLADAATRMRERHVGSVVVVDADERAIGILTERDMIRIAAAGADASTAKVSEWMTADPDTVGPDVEARAAFATPRRSTATGTSRWSTTAARRHRVDARPHAHRDDPARRGPGPRGAEGSRRRRRRRDDRRRRARPRRLLPLPPVQRDRPRAQPAARRRLAAHVRRRAARDARRARARSPPRSGRAASIPEAVRDVLPAIARAGETFVPLDVLRTAISQYGAALGFRPSLDVDAATLLRQRAVDLRGRADAHHRAVAAAAGPASRSTRATTSATRRTTST